MVRGELEIFAHCQFYPRSLILPHLSLDGFNAVLCRFRLLQRNPELPFNFIGCGNGIFRSLLSLSVKYSGLLFHLGDTCLLHDAELASINAERNYSRTTTRTAFTKS